MPFANKGNYIYSFITYFVSLFVLLPWLALSALCWIKSGQSGYFCLVSNLRGKVARSTMLAGYSFFLYAFCQVEVVPPSPIILWKFQFYLNLPFWLMFSDTTLAVEGGGRCCHINIMWWRSLACCHLKVRSFLLSIGWEWRVSLPTRFPLTLWSSWPPYQWVIVKVLFCMRPPLTRPQWNGEGAC